MNRRSLLSLALLSILITMGSNKCEKTCKNYCIDNIQFEAIGYDSSQLAGAVINIYKADGSFSTKLDSGLITKWYFGSTKDSAISDEYSIMYSWVTRPDNKIPAFDAEIIIPSQARTYRVSAITFAGDSLNTNTIPETFSVDFDPCMRYACRRHLSSYILNGNKVSFAASDTNEVSIYLPK